jgi:hypothetical protein
MEPQDESRRMEPQHESRRMEPEDERRWMKPSRGANSEGWRRGRPRKSSGCGSRR